MMPQPSRLQLAEELVRRLAAALRSAQLYAPTHPLVGRGVDALVDVIRQLHVGQPTLVLGVVGAELVVGDTPLPKASATMGELIQRLQADGVERIAIDRGVQPDEIGKLVLDIARRTAGAVAQAGRETLVLPHVRVGRISTDERLEGIAGDLATIRRLYADAVAAAEAIWDSAKTEGRPDLPSARGVVDRLADTVTQNRTALIALTALKSYDNYTFTHMVNVSILTIGQARALGIEGRLLREFGLSALMHDIGKIKTPSEILTKPEKLTDSEFDIMRRHTIEGAEILRRTPEMPILSPVVAFEHHLRLDGSGYPKGVVRPSLNLATMLCSIADVYDAMRSQRAYQEAFPSERILAVLKRNDGQQFDQHLVRRFVQLLGVYPPGTLVRLNTGEIGVVIKVHAPDPYRPAVRVLGAADGQRLEQPYDCNLWEATDEQPGPSTVTAPLDPAHYGIDPLTFLN